MSWQRTLSKLRMIIWADDGLEPECADVGGICGKRHGFEMHRAHAVVGSQDGAEKAAAEMEAHGVCLDGELRGLCGEIAEDDQDGCRGRDVLRFADHDENILIVPVDGEKFAVADGCVAVMKLDEFSVPVEKRVRIRVLDCNVGWCGSGSHRWRRGFPLWR